MCGWGGVGVGGSSNATQCRGMIRRIIIQKMLAVNAKTQI